MSNFQNPKVPLPGWSHLPHAHHHTHCQFQIRTFWIGLLYLVVAGFLAYASFPVIGVAVLIWWLVWSLIRNTTGLLALNENKPIQEPTSWMFGRQPGLRY